jgi:hypothetical protein
LRDEVTLTISKERFEEFISPFMEADDDIDLSSRPREGDLVFFPLGQRLFEIKFVEHEEPFYQLGSNYVYKLKCELFEYEDEVIDTDIAAIDTQVDDVGYIADLQLVGVGRTAQASPVRKSGFIQEIFLNNDGSGFLSAPTVSISTSPSTLNNSDATAVAFTTSRANVTSVEKILITNAGFGYTEAPTITFTGGGGTGVAATCSINTTSNGIVRYIITDGGIGFGTAPVPPPADTVTIGAVPNPMPPSVIIYLTIPFDVVLIEQVAATPVPPPPVNVIVGASVYPNPALVINIFSTEVTFALEVVNATAVASELFKVLGDVLIETVGALKNPEPSLFKKIS